MRVALGDEFNPRNWFTLEVKLFSLSEIEINLDCTLLKKIKLLDPMDPMPKYLEGRLAQSIERDIFTLGWNTNNRFVVSWLFAIKLIPAISQGRRFSVLFIGEGGGGLAGRIAT